MSEDRTEHDVLRSMRRIIRAVALQGRDLARRYQLTAPQLACLKALGPDHGITTGTLARAVSLSPATITGILDRLEMRGLVSRSRSVEDRRRVLVHLTANGHELTTGVPEQLHERFEVRFRSLPERAQRTIAQSLQDVVDMLEASHLDAAPVLAPEVAFTADDPEPSSSLESAS